MTTVTTPITPAQVKKTSRDFTKIGKLNEALEYLEKILAEYGTENNIDVEVMYVAYHGIAYVNWRMGSTIRTRNPDGTIRPEKFEERQTLLSRAKKAAVTCTYVDPDDPVVLSLLAEICFSQGRPETGLDYYKKSLEKAPNQITLYNYSLKLETYKNDPEETMREFEERGPEELIKHHDYNTNGYKNYKWKSLDIDPDVSDFEIMREWLRLSDHDK